MNEFFRIICLGPFFMDGPGGLTLAYYVMVAITFCRGAFTPQTPRLP